MEVCIKVMTICNIFMLNLTFICLPVVSCHNKIEGIIILLLVVRRKQNVAS